MNKDIKEPKKKSLIKRIFIGIGIFILLLFGAALALPYFFKDDIKAFVNKEINENINAKVEFKDVDISLLKSFPNLSTSISDLGIKGIDEFENDSLFFAKEVNLEMDILSLFSNKIKITDFSVVNPIMNITVLPDGKANYDIIKENSDSSNDEKSKIKDIGLESYSVVNAKIRYRDLQSDKTVEISNLNHQGKGDFKDVVFDLETKTDIDGFSFKSGDMHYLKNAKIKWDIDFDTDLNKMIFKIKENTLKLNDLKLVSEGQFHIDDEYSDIDFNIKAPGNSFKEIFSIIPNAFTKDYTSVDAKGNFSFTGNIKGKYFFDKEIYPDFNLDIKAKNGYIKYPDMPLPIQDINANISINKAGESLNNTVVSILPMTFKTGDEKMEMVLNIKNILDNPMSKGKFKGTLNLGALSNAFPVENINDLDGKIATDLIFEFNKTLSYQKLSGKADIDNLSMTYAEFPLIKINDAKLDFTNHKIDINNLKMMAGKSDISGKIAILEPLNYFSKNKSIDLDISGESQVFDANEWMNDDNTSQNDNSKEEEGNLDFLKDRLKVTFGYEIGKLYYEDYDIRDMSLNGQYSKNTLTINNQNLILSDSKLSIKGKLNNILSWILQDKTLNGTLSINSPHFDMDKFMVEGSSNQKKSSKKEDFTVPDKMDLTINTDISQVNYTGKNLKNLQGKLNIKNQTISFNNFNAQGMGGTMIVDGILSTPSDKKPEFDIRYRMSKMRYEEMYKSVVSFKTLAPLSEFIRGVFNADISFKGRLSDGFLPDFSSITAKGLIHTINAYIKNYPGLNNLASKLQINSLDNMEIKDTKNSFEIVDGTVKVNPFDYQYDDMKFNISGTNKLDKTIAYIIHAKIPKSKIGKLPGGNRLNKGIDFITSQAKSKGIDIDVGAILNLDITLTGKYNKPKIGVKFVGASGKSGKEVIDNKIDETKKEIKNEVENKKKEAEKKANEVIDSTKERIKKKAKDKEKELKEKAKKELEKQKKKAKNKVKDALKDLWK